MSVFILLFIHLVLWVIAFVLAKKAGEHDDWLLFVILGLIPWIGPVIEIASYSVAISMSKQ